MKAPEEPHEISQRAAGWPPCFNRLIIIETNFKNFDFHITNDLFFIYIDINFLFLSLMIHFCRMKKSFDRINKSINS